MNVKILLPILLLGITVPMRAGERVALQVSPSVAFAPANLYVRATVDRNAENRLLEIIAESPTFYRSSEIALEGDRAPRVTLLQFKSIPGGEYEVRAVLRGQSGLELASTETRVNVMGDVED